MHASVRSPVNVHQLSTACSESSSQSSKLQTTEGSATAHDDWNALPIAATLLSVGMVSNSWSSRNSWGSDWSAAILWNERARRCLAHSKYLWG